MSAASDEAALWAAAAPSTEEEHFDLAEDGDTAPLPDGIDPLFAAFKEVARASSSFDDALAAYTEDWTLMDFAGRFRPLCCAIAGDASASLKGKAAARRAERSRVYNLVSARARLGKDDDRQRTRALECARARAARAARSFLPGGFLMTTPCYL